METKMCVSTFVLLLVTIAGFYGCHGCDVAGIAACQAFAFQNTSSQVFGAVLSGANVNEACLSYNRYKSCASAFLENCAPTDRITHMAIIYSFDYLCSPNGRAGFTASASCWSNPAIVRIFNTTCMAVLSNVQSPDVCDSYKAYITCANTTTAALCSPEAVDFITALLRISLRPFSENRTCPFNLDLPQPTSTVDPTDGRPTTTPSPTTTAPANSGAFTSKGVAEEANSAILVLNATLRGIIDDNDGTTVSSPTTSTTAFTTTASSTAAPMPEGSRSDPWSNCSAEVNACSRQLIADHGALATQMSRTGPSLPLLETLCPSFEQYAKCVVPHGLGSCSASSERIHLYVRLLLGYTCSPITRATIRLPSVARCWQRNTTMAALVSCSQTLSSDPFDQCGTMKRVMGCYADAVARLCDSRANKLWRGFLIHQGAASKIMLNISDCNLGLPSTSEANPDTTTTPPTTTPPATTTTCPGPIRCFDCNSGQRNSRNLFCPATGKVTSWAVSAPLCDGYCFTRTSSSNRGVVYRGCYSRRAQWLPVLFSTLPVDAAFTTRGNVWRLCNSNRCNTADMTPYLGSWRFRLGFNQDEDDD